MRRSKMKATDWLSVGFTLAGIVGLLLLVLATAPDAFK